MYLTTMQWLARYSDKAGAQVQRQSRCRHCRAIDKALTKRMTDALISMACLPPCDSATTPSTPNAAPSVSFPDASSSRPSVSSPTTTCASHVHTRGAVHMYGKGWP